MTGVDLKEIKLPRSSDNNHRSVAKRQLDKFREPQTGRYVFAILKVTEVSVEKE
jgi:hypothetical protein